jgi:uncharacterized DUF497 family protein
MKSHTAAFEWDDAKNAANVLKHGVDFLSAQKAFLDAGRVIAEDVRHSGRERRYFCIGKSGDGILTVRFTMRGGNIRIIGAGYWRKGKALYEQENGSKKAR